MTREVLNTELARKFFYKAQTRVSSPFYSEAETFIDNILERAIIAGCDIAKKVDLTRGCNNKVCLVNYEEAKIIVEYAERFFNARYSVIVKMKSGETKRIAHRDGKELKRLQKLGVLIDYELEK